VKTIETEIVIDATPDEVWAVLTDFSSYPAWNPFIREISGELRIGAPLKVSLALPGSKPMLIRPVLREASRAWELRWMGSLWLGGLFEGEHAFRIGHEAPRRVRFRQSETFHGILVPLLPDSLYRKIREGFEEMNRALKERVEAGRG